MFSVFPADLSTLKIWRYNDPVMGPRQMPEFQDYKKGKTLLTDGSFLLDVEQQNITWQEEGNAGAAAVPVGRHFIYVVD